MMIRNFTLPGIILGILITVVAQLLSYIIRMPFDPYLRPVLEPLLPSLREQIQSLLAYLTERDIQRAIQYAAIGFFDSAHVLQLTLILMFFFGGFLVVGFQFDTQRKRLIERENPMKLLPKILFGVLTFAFIVISAWAMYELQIIRVSVLANKTFQRNLAIISPYISPQEEKQLRSSWSLMTTRENLQEIDTKMLAIARQNGIPVSERPSGN